ncbi:hypothetical protein CW713_07115 [Methanophagales archaeon]|nr:MAG: hypothetical protein CW714_09915 [Methanophagales archaeon]RJS80843.1 MAG: hypothetical protein CW713_07115 [Methanophagales archaeon]
MHIGIITCEILRREIKEVIEKSRCCPKPAIPDKLMKKGQPIFPELKGGIDKANSLYWLTS